MAAAAAATRKWCIRLKQENEKLFRVVLPISKEQNEKIN
jgi:hypothetical protein